MIKVLCVVDKVGTAIDRLAQGVKPYHDNIEFEIVDVHPKRPSQEQLSNFEHHALDASIIDFQYWKSAEMLLSKYDWLNEKKLLLQHHNPYSITESGWDHYDMVIANNETILAELELITESELELIPNTQDPNFFFFKRNFEKNKNVIMVANRIESKKGIFEVALACQELNLRLILVGSISDRGYFEEIMSTKVVEFYNQITDEELRDLYHNSTIHVCNSIDNFESGTMPILEAMMCGVPVLTRDIGHVPDIYNGENMCLNNSTPDDVETLIRLLELMMTDPKRLETMRNKAWESVKGRNHARRAYSYQKAYRHLMGDDIPISIVVPIYEKPEVTRECLNALAEQTYNNYEIIVVDDSDLSQENLVKDIAKTISKPVRYIHSGKGDYGLARARNLGIIEATGDIMVFCDQRMILEPDAVSKLIENITAKTWVFGNKNGKKTFVENFSAVYRQELIQIGMFNERITGYGGMSQDIRERSRLNGITHTYVPDAKATPRGKSKNKYAKRGEIIDMKNILWKLGL